MFTSQQAMMALRWAMNAAGVWMMTRGYGNDEIFTALGGVVMSAFPFIWGWIRHSKYGTIIAADEITDVAGVVMKETTDGRALAKAIPSSTVVSAGSAAAAQIARASPL